LTSFLKASKSEGSSNSSTNREGPTGVVGPTVLHNVAKVRPQQQVQHQPQQTQHPGALAAAAAASSLPHYSHSHANPSAAVSASGAPGDYKCGGVGIGVGGPVAAAARNAGAVAAANFAANNHVAAAVANNSLAASLASPPSLYQVSWNSFLECKIKFKKKKLYLNTFLSSGLWKPSIRKPFVSSLCWSWIGRPISSSTPSDLRFVWSFEPISAPFTTGSLGPV